MPRQMSLDNMGLMNKPWGVCGFTSVLYAVHGHSSKAKQEDLETGASRPRQVLAEIKTYLKLLEATGETKEADIVASIEKFTQSFDGFSTWTVTDYVNRVNEAVVISNKKLRTNDKFGIGMPPNAVVDYMQRVWAFNNAKILDLSASGTEMILGMGTDKLGMPLYDGLGHYLYTRNNIIYSWGGQFSDARTAMHNVGNVDARDWKIVCKIGL